MPHYDTPTDHAAALILMTAPVARRIADDRRWIDEDGWIDWAKVETDFDDMGYLSGAENRLIRAAVLLHKADLWGLDCENGTAVAEAFRAAADGYLYSAKAAGEAEERFTRT